MNKLLITALLLLEFGCAYEIRTYDQMILDAEASGDYTEVEQFERTVEKAEAYYINKQLCFDSTDHVWFCSGHYRSTRVNREPPDTPEALVRQYRREKHDCGCISSADVRDLYR